MTDTATRQRPLSPHLQVYRWPITMAMSIAHRVTGGALYVGTLLLVWLLVAAASGEGAYDFASGVFGSLLGRLVLFGYSFVLFHHLLGGLRHFIWDTGRGMEPGTRDTIAWATLAGSLALTVIVWIIALAKG
jgi:succinate dehydrogenase / fumarate reductase cytochrome b subunit